MAIIPSVENLSLCQSLADISVTSRCVQFPKRNPCKSSKCSCFQTLEEAFIKALSQIRTLQGTLSEISKVNAASQEVSRDCNTSRELTVSICSTNPSMYSHLFREAIDLSRLPSPDSEATLFPSDHQRKSSEGGGGLLKAQTKNKNAVAISEDASEATSELRLAKALLTLGSLRSMSIPDKRHMPSQHISIVPNDFQQLRSIFRTEKFAGQIINLKQMIQILRTACSLVRVDTFFLLGEFNRMANQIKEAVSELITDQYKQQERIRLRLQTLSKLIGPSSGSG